MITTKAVFIAYNHYGYMDSYVEGFILADDQADAERILKERNTKFDKPDILIRVEELRPIQLDKAPY